MVVAGPAVGAQVPLGADAQRRARRAGASEVDLNEAEDAGIPLAHYASAREAGATHDEVLDASRAGASVHFYAACRQVPARLAVGGGSGTTRLVPEPACAPTHNEVMTAYASGADLRWYAWVRQQGIGRAQAMDLATSSLRFADSGKWRVAMDAQRRVALLGGGAAASEAVAALAEQWPGTAEELAVVAGEVCAPPQAGTP